MSWTDKDKKRVRAVIDHITTDISQAEFSRELGTKSRASVNNWRRRGRVPIEHIPAVIKAAAPGMVVTPGQLHPDARIIEQQSRQATKGKVA